MAYRVCKAFEIEAGHMLSKHPGLCRYPHGHSRRVEVVLRAAALDANEMVCDFKTIKLALSEFLARWDHALAINSDDPALGEIRSLRERVVVFDGRDPTTEVLARAVFDFLAAELAAGREYHDRDGAAYRFPRGVTLERVRVGETSTSWAEYGAD